MTAPRFLIVASGYNCAQYVRGCLESVLAQSYTDYHVAIVDDASTDETEHEIILFARAHDYLLPSWTVHRLPENIGTVAARDHAIRYAVEKGVTFDVIVWLDLDDELEPHALERVAREYQERDVWLTYGNYIDSAGQVPFNESNIHFPDEVHEARSYRTADWRFMHLRTFRRELYERLTPADLFPTPEPGAYGDASMAYSMLEMAGRDRIGVITDVLYRYNTANPLGVSRRFSAEERAEQLRVIQAMPKLEQLSYLTLEDEQREKAEKLAYEQSRGNYKGRTLDSFNESYPV